MKGPETRLYLLDIEGTLAPMSLVTEQLFPYARTHFREFLKANLRDAAVRADLELLDKENRAETDPTCPWTNGDPDADAETWCNKNLAYLIWLMDRDRKSTALKSLQGKIWKAGFESGELKGTLFADVPAALERWSKRAKVAIYSSGSVEAQRILFRHTIFGDLTPYVSAYFDTRTGPKIASPSYEAIAKAVGVWTAEILFFSDSIAELDAARKAQCYTRLVMRPGNVLVDDAHGHAVIETLAQMS
jgi:enolase-phosphatase E1